MHTFNKKYLLISLYALCLTQRAYTTFQRCQYDAFWRQKRAYSDFDKKYLTPIEKERFKQNSLITLKKEEYLHSMQTKTLNKELSPKIKQFPQLPPPLIIIGVPGLGYQSYTAMDSYCQYLQFRFFHMNQMPNENLYYIISGSPGLNKDITEKNCMQNNDFKNFIQTNGRKIDGWDYDAFLDKKIYSDTLDFTGTISEENAAPYFERYKSNFFPNSLMPDLGQENCLKCFEETVVKKIAKLPQNEFEVIFHANSQGTGTTLGYLANLVKNGLYNANLNSFMINGKKITVKAIILEAPFAKGKNAIAHTAKSITNYLQYIPYGFLASTLLKHCLDRYSAKLTNILRKSNIQIAHDPEKKQPIDFIKKIPQSVPVIIAHSKDDREVPFSDGEALYNARKEINSSNSYFITLEGSEHCKLFQKIISEKKHARLPCLKSVNNFEIIDVLANIPEIHQILHPNKEYDQFKKNFYTNNFQPN